MRLIYLSHASEDRDFGEELKKRLNAPHFQKHYGISCWSVSDAVPGTEWQKQMAEHLAQASIFVALIDADYQAEERCHAEMLAALRLFEQKRIRHIIPVLLRACDIEGYPLASFYVYPRDKHNEVKPLTAWKKRDEAWQNVQQGIVRKLIGEDPNDTHLPQLR